MSGTPTAASVCLIRVIWRSPHIQLDKQRLGGAGENDPPSTLIVLSCQLLEKCEGTNGTTWLAAASYRTAAPKSTLAYLD
ncbi:Hypothetical predicted protein [Cloeon dipterum]|uniref:Uncharacterized protein n=1 Tax=Cloeon dipterum TaxID=197152 RepID=A0A8S1D8B1_9INSE|nr:Hypothetical predicted protein [Cloeon dipterum]